MAELIAKSPLAGQGPVVHGGLELVEMILGQVTSIAPFKRQENAVAALLKKRGLGFPTPNSVLEKGATRIVWTGRGQAFLIGATPDGLENIAALTDQSDGWACLSLTGAEAAEALIRLIPLDLQAMQPGQAARSQLGHMQAIITRRPGGFEVMVFRSMARTAWHEVEGAMKALAARHAMES